MGVVIAFIVAGIIIVVVTLGGTDIGKLDLVLISSLAAGTGAGLSLATTAG